MSFTKSLRNAAGAIVAATTLLGVTGALGQPIEPEFSYRGRLLESGAPANGAFDFEFELFGALVGGTKLGPTLMRNDVQVADGFFTVLLNFDDGSPQAEEFFGGDQRWIGVRVRPGVETGAFTSLAPRQALTPTPFSIFSLEAAEAESADDAFTLRGKADSDFWQTTGNDNTTAGVNFIGTNDDQPLEFRVQGSRALRLELGDFGAVNVIGGADGNVVTASAGGAVIGGGGAAADTPMEINRVTDSLGTISGGRANRAGNDDADNFNAAFATVGGGTGNVAGANWATIAGGENNAVGGDRATIGGGSNNMAGGNLATVPGGSENIASGEFSFAAGSGAHALHDGSFVWKSASASTLQSTEDGQFLVGAVNFWFGHPESATTVQGFISTSTGANLSFGGLWTNSSDANKKENFEAVDGEEVLERLAELPVRSWNYKAEDPSVRHVGPTAQDFSAAFGLGADDRHIASLDTGGIAMAAIKALYAKLQEKDAAIAALSARLEALEQMIGDKATQGEGDGG